MVNEIMEIDFVGIETIGVICDGGSRHIRFFGCDETRYELKFKIIRRNIGANKTFFKTPELTACFYDQQNAITPSSSVLDWVLAGRLLFKLGKLLDAFEEKQNELDSEVIHGCHSAYKDMLYICASNGTLIK